MDTRLEAWHDGIIESAVSLTRAVALAALLSTALPLCAAEPAPRIYMTPKYGLLMQMPASYFHCPLPDGWIGADHGTTL